MLDPQARAVLDFWFDELWPPQWFTQDASLDASIRARFGALYENLVANGVGDWDKTAEGCLAAILVFDQFPRNMFRDDPRAFATDEKARALTRHALDKGFDTDQPEDRRAFFYIPLEHSEDAADQEKCCDLMRQLSNPTYLDFAERHRAIIDRFGRFPHRNAILGRDSTPEELAFLEEEGSAF